MQIIPYVGDTPLDKTTFSIHVDEKEKARVSALVARAREVILVNSAETFAVAKYAAGQLKALIDEIEDAKKASKRPQTALNNAINDLATTISAPLETEQKRILALLNGYVARIEAELVAERKRREEAMRAELAEQAKKLAEAQAAQKAAEEAARKAKDEAERLRLQAEEKRWQEAAEDAQLARELAQETARAEPVEKVKVPGGRVDHPYDFELINVEQTIAAGQWRLLNWSLDKRACMDVVRAQLEKNFRDGVDHPITLPGIRVTQRTSVSIRATI